MSDAMVIFLWCVIVTSILATILLVPGWIRHRRARHVHPREWRRCEDFYWQYQCEKELGHDGRCRFWLDSGDVIEMNADEHRNP